MKVEKALARRVALLGVKVTGIKPPRLSFVAVDGRPISRGFDSCRTHFLREIKKRKEKEKEKEKEKTRNPHLRAKIGLCGERTLNLLNVKMMLRGSLTSDKNK